MKRPRSLLGLLLRLAILHARGRPWLVLASCLAFVAVVASLGGGGPQSSTGPVQAGVLTDGFAVLHGNPATRHVLELDQTGAKRREVALDLAADARIFGTRSGTGVGWHEGNKVKVAVLDEDGELGPPSTWGRSAQQLCTGVATGDARFAVGWLEADGSVWFVHGPVAPASVEQQALVVEPLRARWCGVASAEHNVALLWRGDHVYLDFCGTRGCSQLVTRLEFAPSQTILDFGCLRDRCLIATRDRDGITRVTLATQLEKVRWTRTLDVGRDAAVAIVGVGDRSFAVATGGNEGAVVHRFALDGTATEVWRRRGAEAPSLVWSSGRLAVAYRRGGKVAAELVALPR